MKKELPERIIRGFKSIFCGSLSISGMELLISTQTYIYNMRLICVTCQLIMWLCNSSTGCIGKWVSRLIFSYAMIIKLAENLQKTETVQTALVLPYD